MLTGMVGLVVAAGFRQPIGAAQPDDATKPESANMQALTAIDKAINLGGKAECEQAAIKLRELGTRDLTQTERETWLRLSRDTAIRNADLKTLQALKEIPDSFSLDSIYTVLLAYGKLAKADVAGATAQLDCLHDLHNINPREERRIYALRARIAQVRGNLPEERANIEKMVDHLPHWPQPMCQTCHSSFTEKTKMTGLPIQKLWFGERFVELMKQQGDAEVVRAEAAAQLKQFPKNDRARIREAFALQALGRPTEADKLFHELTWADFPERNLARPHMMTAFP
jgi:hypothetical protein